MSHDRQKPAASEARTALKLLERQAVTADRPFAVLVSDPDRVIRRETRDADQRAIDTGGEAGHEIFKLVRT